MLAQCLPRLECEAEECEVHMLGRLGAVTVLADLYEQLVLICICLDVAIETVT
jgi:hypothetical protein